jgi:hypothetical protein
MIDIILIVVLSISMALDLIFIRLSKKYRIEQSKFNELTLKKLSHYMKIDELLNKRIDQEVDRINQLEREINILKEQIKK